MWTLQINWQSGDNGKTQYANDCDIDDHDNGNASSNSGECGGKCLARPGCKAFSWYKNVCYFKTGGTPRPSNGVLCGRVVA